MVMEQVGRAGDGHDVQRSYSAGPHVCGSDLAPGNELSVGVAGAESPRRLLGACCRLVTTPDRVILRLAVSAIARYRPCYGALAIAKMRN